MREEQKPCPKKIKKAIDVLWNLHDERQTVGDTSGAREYAERAFELLTQLPENCEYVQTHH